MSQKHQQHMLIHPLPTEWKLPVNLAIGFHILVLFCAMVLPGLLNQQTKLPEITTIDLVSMAEPSAKNEPAAAPAAKQEKPPETKQEAAPPAPPKPPETLKPEVTKQVPPPSDKAIPVPEPTVTPEPAAPAAPPAPAEAISIKPLKQKVKKEVKEPPPDTRVEDTKIRKEELKNITKKLQEEAKKESAVQETIRLQRQQAAAREEARRAELEARMAAADAKNALRDQLRATSSASSSAAASSPGASNGQNKNIIETQYHVTIGGIIQLHWQPPEVKTWDPNIFALVTIIVASDGQIVSKIIDQGSGDSLFDQFVLKTLETLPPLPPPPPALQKQRVELPFRFKPSGIQ